MVQLKRNKETGEVEAYKDGKKIGSVITMGDEVRQSGGNRDNMGR